MSMCICDKCTASIDSDYDPDCFIEDFKGYKGRDLIICETCREKEPERDEPRTPVDEIERVTK